MRQYSTPLTTDDHPCASSSSLQLYRRPLLFEHASIQLPRRQVSIDILSNSAKADETGDKQKVDWFAEIRDWR
jgi:hypothetical protein